MTFSYTLMAISALTFLLSFLCLRSKCYLPAVFWLLIAILPLPVLPVCWRESAIHGTDGAVTWNQVYRYYRPLYAEPQPPKIAAKVSTKKTARGKTVAPTTKKHLQ